MEPPKAGVPGAAGGGRSDRPLGRGLEDVSHVFLSPRLEQGGPAPAVGMRPERPFTREESPAGALLLRPMAQVTRAQVAAALREFAGALEAGLQAIDAELPCPPGGEIDVLAVDRASQLTIIDFDTTANDELLLRGLGHVDWMVRNVPSLRRMYRGQAINFSLPPRLMLLGPWFSPRVRQVARQLTAARIGWLRYQFVETPGGPGVFFEPAPPEQASFP
jgi:hypothetical protein